MTTTLATWTCDTCGETIDGPEQGIVAWGHSPADEFAVDRFVIVHRLSVRPSCDPDGNTSSMELAHMVGDQGFAILLSFLSVGPIRGGGGQKITNFDNYVDTVRRLQVPGYEQARSKFGSQEVADEFGDATEYSPYLPETLEKIIRL
ncbi:hypothetical protein [Dietzia sp. 111N12-1]|uniref:hypothetical protein n=1 Tax=Dietzia sp. 111N12-1 TaxID=1785156 RepID=UPI0012E8216B|nr:hypothetical protein [Dietzia sp. 111N12-1]